MPDDPDRHQLEALAAWGPPLEDPAFRVGSWVKSWTDTAGVIHMGWFERGPDLLAFLADVGRNGWIEVFDWVTWARSPRGQLVLQAPGGPHDASADELRKILTAIIRSDRFTEGSIAGAFESGLLSAVAIRAGVLARSAPIVGWAPERIDI